MSKPKAIVVLSGGQDSTTCLYLAKHTGYDPYCITFDYGQLHRLELVAARKVADAAGCGHTHRYVTLRDVLRSRSPLLDRSVRPEVYANVEAMPSGIEKTFVPMRNQLFLTIAANYAAAIGTSVIYTGVGMEDYGGYPDCREDFIKSFEDCSNTGTFLHLDNPQPLEIKTPLMFLSKKQVVQLAMALGDCYYALALTHTAYINAFPPQSNDHASLLRARGFLQAGVPDPLVLFAHMKGKLDRLPETSNYTDDVCAPIIPRLESFLKKVGVAV